MKIVDVDVIAWHKKEGKCVPLFVIWENMVKYKIDKCYEVGQRACPYGGCGILYRCRIQGRERNLYRDQDRWFLVSEQT